MSDPDFDALVERAANRQLDHNPELDPPIITAITAVLETAGVRELLMERAELANEIKRLKSYIHNFYTPEIERLKLKLKEEQGGVAAWND